MQTLLKDVNNKLPEYDFTPRLGHNWYDKVLTLVSKGFTVTQNRHNIGIKMSTTTTTTLQQNMTHVTMF